MLAPSDRAIETHEKIREYLEAGVAAVWVVYLQRAEGDIWNRNRPAVSGAGTLTADCIPGFELRLNELIPENMDCSAARRRLERRRQPEMKWLPHTLSR